MQLLECDRCGLRAAPSGSFVVIADGWQVFTVARPGAEGRLAVICPGCWNEPDSVRFVLAEALG